eukprot:s3250_g3.t2
MLLMKPPRGGLTQFDASVPEDAILMCRVPVYGTKDAGRGFYLRMNAEILARGFKASQVCPATYFLFNKACELAAMICTHVGNLLFAHTEEGKEADDDFTIHADVQDNTRGLKPAMIGRDRKMNDTLTGLDRPIRSAGSCISRERTPTILSCTVQNLKDANRVVELALQGSDFKIAFKTDWIDWNDLAVVTFSDASFANEAEFKSQQGRIHYITTRKNVRIGGVAHLRDPALGHQGWHGRKQSAIRDEDMFKKLLAEKFAEVVCLGRPWPPLAALGAKGWDCKDKATLRRWCRSANLRAVHGALVMPSTQAARSGDAWLSHARLCILRHARDLGSACWESSVQSQPRVHSSSTRNGLAQAVGSNLSLDIQVRPLGLEFHCSVPLSKEAAESLGKKAAEEADLRRCGKVCSNKLKELISKERRRRETLALMKATEGAPTSPEAKNETVQVTPAAAHADLAEAPPAKPETEEVQEVKSAPEALVPMCGHVPAKEEAAARCLEVENRLTKPKWIKAAEVGRVTKGINCMVKCAKPAKQVPGANLFEVECGDESGFFTVQCSNRDLCEFCYSGASIRIQNAHLTFKRKHGRKVRRVVVDKWACFKPADEALQFKVDASARARP